MIPLRGIVVSFQRSGDNELLLRCGLKAKTIGVEANYVRFIGHLIVVLYRFFLVVGDVNLD